MTLIQNPQNLKIQVKMVTMATVFIASYQKLLQVQFGVRGLGEYQSRGVKVTGQVKFF